MRIVPDGSGSIIRNGAYIIRNGAALTAIGTTTITGTIGTGGTPMMLDGSECIIRTGGHGPTTTISLMVTVTVMVTATVMVTDMGTATTKFRERHSN